MKNFNHGLKFKKSFENQCIKLIVEAYTQILKDKSIQIDFMENDITETLRTNVMNNPLKNDWRIYISRDPVIPNPNAVVEKGFANKFKKVDLVMETYVSSTQRAYSIEAKNLKEKDSALKRRYIETGIDSFIENKYPYGFLIGYLLEGGVVSTIIGINKLLEKDGRTIEVLGKKEHKLVKHYYESNHAKLCLKHLIFDFTML